MAPGLERFRRADRPWWLERLAREPFDLLVVGGGITGAAILRDAALRGLRVALLEARDFAAGTSSRSSKLIHGGLRYLRRLEVRLAWESSHERDLQLALNRRLVRPLPFLLPTYRGRSPSRALLRAGMWAYRAVSGFPGTRRPRFLGATATSRLAPGLPRTGLTGGAIYYDATVDDGRWTLEHIKDGVRHGGLALPHVAVTGFLRERGAVAGATWRDALSGTQGEVRARAVVNATGVSADLVRRLDDPDAERVIRLDKGTHLVFRAADVPLAVSVAFLSPLDGRPLFLIRRGGCCLYGTTDDWEQSDPDQPRPGEQEAGYLLESLRHFLPDAHLDRSKLLYAFSGFRPLIAASGADARAERSSREDLVLESRSGLVTVVGGKLTTARLMARRALERLQPRFAAGPPLGACATGRIPLGGGAPELEAAIAAWRPCSPLAPQRLRALFERYGLDANAICSAAASSPPDWEESPFPGVIRAELAHVCGTEMVCTLADLVDRRLDSLRWSPAERLGLLEQAEAVVGAELDLSRAEYESGLQGYREHLARCTALPHPP